MSAPRAKLISKYKNACTDLRKLCRTLFKEERKDNCTVEIVMRIKECLPENAIPSFDRMIEGEKIPWPLSIAIKTALWIILYNIACSLSEYIKKCPTG